MRDSQAIALAKYLSKQGSPYVHCTGYGGDWYVTDGYGIFRTRTNLKAVFEGLRPDDMSYRVQQSDNGTTYGPAKGSTQVLPEFWQQAGAKPTVQGYLTGRAMVDPVDTRTTWVEISTEDETLRGFYNYAYLKHFTEKGNLSHVTFVLAKDIDSPPAVWVDHRLYLMPFESTDLNYYWDRDMRDRRNRREYAKLYK